MDVQKITTVITLFIITGCMTQAPQPNESDSNSPLRQGVTIEDHSLINQKLSAIEALIADQQGDEAQIILNTLEFTQMTIEQKTRYALAQADIALLEGQGQNALRWLNAEYSYLFDSLPLAKQIDISLKRSNAYELSGDMLASARERIFLDPVLNQTQQKRNQEQIWYNLALVPEVELRQLIATESSPDLTGWAELSLINRTQAEDLYRLITDVDHWRSTHPRHPAAINLPESLQVLREIAVNQPQHLGILLPLSGPLEKAGKAIRDGLLAAWHQTKNNHPETPVLRFYNTANSEDIRALYKQAVTEGAQIIIGPLDKTRVQQLAKIRSLSVPVLALNYAEQNLKATPNFYQFGLAPEDEVRQVAEDVWQQGVRNVMVIAPQSDWGNRVSDVFVEQWQLKGGSITSKAMFTQPDKYLSAIKQALNIDTSELRKAQLQQLLNTDLEFESRRRQDVDLIFLLAFPAQARQLKPLLLYQRAGNIPIAAISTIHSGQSDRAKDSDLNDIQFVDMPWRLTPSLLKSQAQRAFPDSLNNYASLVALGIDAYRLYPRVPQMAVFNGVRLQGDTGLMSMNESGQIERLLNWALFKNGLVNTNSHFNLQDQGDNTF